MVESFNKVMEKYKFTTPIEPGAQALFASSSKQALVDVMKGASEYSFIFGASASIYYQARRLGLRIKFYQAQFLLGLSALVLAGSIAGAGYLIINNIITRPSYDKKIEDTIKTGEKKSVIKENIIIREKGALAGISLGIIVKTDDSILKEKASNLLLAGIKKQTNIKNAYLLTARNRKAVNKIIECSITNAPGKDFVKSVRVKLISVETGRVEFAGAEAGDVNNVCNALSSQVSKRILELYKTQKRK